MAFPSPITDGDGTLVIDRVKSEGFQTGVSGWQIEKDGDAEFNSLTIRSTDLTLTGASPINGASTAGYSVQDLLYWELGNLVYFNVRLVVNAAGAGAVNIGIAFPFIFENTNSAGRQISQVFPFVHTNLGGGYPTATGSGVCVSAAGGITQFRGEGGTFIQGQHLIIGTQIVVQGMGIIE